MTETETREQLDRLRCEKPDCDHAHGNIFYLIAPCHPRAGLDVRYNQDAGCLLFGCRRCGSHIARITVAA